MSEARIALGAFDLLEPAGKGGMGEVWRGVHRDDGLAVAVKMVEATFASIPMFDALFRHEARAVAALDHPHVVLLFDHGEVDAEAAERSQGRLSSGAPYLVMEWASGGTLASSTPMPRWSDLRAALGAILEALAHAHARGVIHRDLKLSNVLVCSEDDARPGPKLADFGVAQRRGEAPADAAVSGTRAYMAPEQASQRWRDEGPWTDLFALGVLGWKLASGAAPFHPDADPETRAPAPLLAAPPDTPRGYEGWLRTLLEPDPRRRFRRAADAMEALEEVDREPRQVIAWPAPPRASPDAPTMSEPNAPRFAGGDDGPSTAEGLVRGARVAVPTPLGDWRSIATPSPVRLSGAGLGLFGLRTVPLVDRDDERAGLWTALREVSELDEPRVVVLSGTAGTGKSRLAQWLGERAHELGAATVLRAQHGPIPGPGDSLAPMFARHLGCAGLDESATAARVRQLLDVHGDDEDAEARSIAAWIAGRERPGSAAERNGLLRGLLERVAVDRPVVLIADDAQWAPESLSFVTHLLGSRVPALILFTVREEALALRPAEKSAIEALLAHPHVRRIEVAPLPLDHRAALVRGALGLSAELAARVEERALGNPQLVLRIVADWTHRGLLEPSPAGFQLRADGDARFPDDERAMWRSAIQEALAGCTPAEACALEIAAMLGQDVDPGEWEAACAHAEATSSIAPRAVEELLERGLARSARDGRWSFAQAMVCEALVQRAEDEGRAAAHHRACAAAIGSRASIGRRRGGSHDEERRGRHLLAAGDPEAAAGPLLAAAEALLGGGESGRAEALLVDLGAAAPGASRPAIAALLAEARRIQGRYDEAETLAAEAAESSDPAIRARAHAVRGGAARERGKPDVMLSSYLAAVDEARRAGDEALVASCSRWVGIGHLDRGEPDRARGWFDGALAAALASGDELAAARARLTLGGAERMLGNLGAARDQLERALAGMRRAGARGGVADCLNALGELARSAGDPDRAVDLYQRSAELHESLGSRSELVARLNLGLALIQSGRLSDAHTVLVAVAPRLERQGRRGLAAMAHVALLACVAAAGDREAWDAHVTVAERLIAETRFADLELARAAERAAGAAPTEMASAAWRIAAQQWRALGKTAEADRAGARAGTPPT